MYGILGEDKSDVATLKVILKRLLDNNDVSVKTKGYSGCGELFRKGAKQLAAFNNLGLEYFIICCDADSTQGTDRRDEVIKKIVQKSGVENNICIVIPIQELEAWILADIQKVSKVISGWAPEDIKSPELINSPKEYLEKLSRAANKKPRYSHATHNERVAEHLDLEKVNKKCPSFSPLVQFAKQGKGNYFPKPDN